MTVLADPVVSGVNTGDRSGLIYDPVQPSLGFQFQECKSSLPPLNFQVSFSPPLGAYLLFGKTSFGETLRYFQMWGAGFWVGYRVYSRLGIRLGAQAWHFMKQKASASGTLPIEGGLTLLNVSTSLTVEF